MLFILYFCPCLHILIVIPQKNFDSKKAVLRGSRSLKVIEGLCGIQLRSSSQFIDLKNVSRPRLNTMCIVSNDIVIEIAYYYSRPLEKSADFRIKRFNGVVCFSESLLPWLSRLSSAFIYLFPYSILYYEYTTTFGHDYKMCLFLADKDITLRIRGFQCYILL